MSTKIGSPPIQLVPICMRGYTGNVSTYPHLYSYCTCTVAQCVLCLHPLYSDSASPAGAIYILPVLFILVLCAYYCTVCTVRVPVVQWFGMASTDRVPIGPCLYSYCGCTKTQCVLCLYLFHSDLAWPAWVMYILPVFVLVLCVYYCTVCTVRVPLVQWFSMASMGRVPIGPCLNSYCACTIAQCVLCLYLLYIGLAWPARVMYILPVFVLVLCVWYCTVCTVRVPLYRGLAWPARAVYLLAGVCTRTVVVPLHSVYCACTSCTVFWHGQPG